MPIPIIKTGATEVVKYEGVDKDGNAWTGQIAFKRLSHGDTFQVMADVAATREDADLQAQGAAAVWRRICEVLARGIASIDGQTENLGQLLDVLDDAAVVNSIQDHLLEMNVLTRDMSKNSSGSPVGFLSLAGGLTAKNAKTAPDASSAAAASEADPKGSPSASST